MSNHSDSHHTHPYHLVNPSPWPAVGAGSLLALTIGGAMFMHKVPAGIFVLLLGFAGILYTMFAWWRDVIKEAHVEHQHTREVSRGLRAGMALFIVSEVLFFAAFFWAFFNASTLPKLPLEETWAIADGSWPPKGIVPFDPFHLPFLNTLILLLSGTTVTWAHWCILHNDRAGAIKALWYTVILGVMFTSCQAYEYTHAAFGFKQGIYASTFYMATGFHGFHVLVGTIFLAVCLGRAYKGHFTPQQHLGFEFAAWYWHFVDVVWIFLFIFVYCNFASKFTLFSFAMIALFMSLAMVVAAWFLFVRSGTLAKTWAKISHFH